MENTNALLITTATAAAAVVATGTAASSEGIKKRDGLRRSPSVLDLTRVPLLPAPQLRRRHTLVVGMDNTILAARREMLPLDQGSQYFKVAGDMPFVYVRPCLNLFLKCMAMWFELVLFTRSSKPRADCFLDKIDTDKRIQFRIYRESSGTKNKQVKDLSLLGRDMSNVIIIDSDPIAYQHQQGNAIPIKRFEGLKSDSELEDLIPFLCNLKKLDDVRPLISSTYAEDIRPVKNHREII